MLLSFTLISLFDVPLLPNTTTYWKTQYVDMQIADM